MDFGNLSLKEYKNLIKKLGNDIVEYSTERAQKYCPGDDNASQGVPILIIATVEALATYISAYKRLVGMTEEHSKEYLDILLELLKTTLEHCDLVDLDDN